ncbi:MAG TPA: sulfotransferase [Pyrinomonadaceae bacterium]|nr:sulfotransferase [Pyrinomonadaceae bacterium]
MASNSFEGWLPVDAVVVQGRPGLLWMNMNGVDFAEPFFQQTVDRAKLEQPARAERFTEFDTLVQLEKDFASVPPTGFIFHSSRCGSTLLANACRAIEGSIVLSEPPAVDKLAARFITDVDEPVGQTFLSGSDSLHATGDRQEYLSYASTKELLYCIFLRATVTALGQRRTGRERRLFVKFACCSVSQLERIRRIWPNVPWVFLYRDPIETVVSNMQNLPTWLQDDDHRVLASITGASTAEVAQMSKEELCARSLGSFYTTAHRVANDRALLLNYNQLSTAEIANVLKFFGVIPTEAEMETIARQSHNYSKATLARRFVADTESKHTLATDFIREAAARWANKPYQLLEHKRLGISNDDVI